jgi:ribosomal protein S12 methylthiotransferase accessory factor
MAEMLVTFPGGARVDAQYGQFVICTDQSPQEGGEGTAPSPFELFLASLATCAGVYVSGFCRQRGLPLEGVRIIQRWERDSASGLIRTIALDIHVPSDFPEKYRPALIRAAGQCAVKKALESPPTIAVQTILD